MSVLPGVSNHGLIKWSLPPIGQLILLLRGYVAKFLQQVAQRVVRILEDSCGLSGVEHVDHIDAKVFLKPLDVKVGAVEHFNQRPVGEYLVEAMHFGSQFDGVYDKVVGARMTFVVSRCEVTLQKPVGDVLFVDHISHEIANAMVKACFGRRDYDEDEGGIVLHVKMIRGIRARLHVPCTRGIFESVFNNVVEQIRHMKVTELNIHLSGSIASQPISSKLREYDSFTEIMTTLMSDIPNIVSKFEIFYLN